MEKSSLPPVFKIINKYFDNISTEKAYKKTYYNSSPLKSQTDCNLDLLPIKRKIRCKLVAI